MPWTYKTIRSAKAERILFGAFLLRFMDMNGIIKTNSAIPTQCCERFLLYLRIKQFLRTQKAAAHLPEAPCPLCGHGIIQLSVEFGCR